MQPAHGDCHAAARPWNHRAVGELICARLRGESARARSQDRRTRARTDCSTDVTPRRPGRCATMSRPRLSTHKWPPYTHEAASLKMRASPNASCSGSSVAPGPVPRSTSERPSVAAATRSRQLGCGRAAAAVPSVSPAGSDSAAWRACHSVSSLNAAAHARHTRDAASSSGRDLACGACLATTAMRSSLGSPAHRDGASVSDSSAQAGASSAQGGVIEASWRRFSPSMRRDEPRYAL